MVYKRYIPPEEARGVEKAVTRDLRRSLIREGDIKDRSEIERTAYRWTEERIKRY